ncbi:pirin-like protein [Zingiber officinale]|uniref:pirin-like protein n=1 Tax=Zingiber officinale TaxID=94328 RepID=UPI001C4D675E|nr:pirin-like protein [Zingiber officinale]
MDHETPSLEVPRKVLSVIFHLLPILSFKFHVKKCRCWNCREDAKFLDPFILLDEFTVSSPAGFPDHPHKGFEAITYMLEGAFATQDFNGHKSILKAGDVQWLNTGRGIIHSEMSAAEGQNKALQLWINLSSEHKMLEPRSMEVESRDVARVEKGDFNVAVIVGESHGVRSAVDTVTPIMFLDFTLKPGAQVRQGVPRSWNAFAYVLEGEGVFGHPSAPPATEFQAVLLGDGDGVEVWNHSSEKSLRFLLIGGLPVGEPVVHRGPFVMNTEAEVEEAIQDFRNNRNGFQRRS